MMIKFNICDECGNEFERLYPQLDEIGKMRRLCWNCYQKYYKDLAKSIRNGQKDLRGYDEKYKKVPKINLKGEIKRG